MEERERTVGAERKVPQRGGGVLEAVAGGADLVEAVLEEVDLQIRLLLEPLELLHAQLVQFDPNRVRHGSGLAS